MADDEERGLDPQAQEIAAERPGCAAFLTALLALGLALLIGLGVVESVGTAWLLVLAIVLFFYGLGRFVVLLARALRSVALGLALRRERGLWRAGTVVDAVVLAPEPPPGSAPVAVLEVRPKRGEPWELPLPMDLRAVRPEGERWAYPLRIPLPSDAPAQAEWRVRWRSRRGAASFVLPVAPGGGAELAMERLRDEALRRDPLAALALAGIRVEDAGERAVIHIPAWRTPRAHARACAWAGFFTALGVLGSLAVDPWFLAVALLFIVQLWLATLRAAWWRARLVLGRDAIALAAGWLLVGERAVPLAAVRGPTVETAMGLAGRTAQIGLEVEGGPPLPIAYGLPLPPAERLLQLIALYLQRHRPAAPAPPPIPSRDDDGG